MSSVTRRSSGARFRDLKAEYDALDCVVLGVSADHEVSHGKFIAKYGLTFSLLADTDRYVLSHVARACVCVCMCVCVCVACVSCQCVFALGGGFLFVHRSTYIQWWQSHACRLNDYKKGGDQPRCPNSRTSVHGIYVAFSSLPQRQRFFSVKVAALSSITPSNLPPEQRIEQRLCSIYIYSLSFLFFPTEQVADQGLRGLQGRGQDPAEHGAGGQGGQGGRRLEPGERSDGLEATNLQVCRL